MPDLLASNLQELRPMPGASWEEVGELIGISDRAVIRQVVETGASVDEIGEALSDLETERPPRTELATRLHRILAERKRDDNTFSIMGVPI